MRRWLLLLALIPRTASAQEARAEAPADRLLRLVPPDAGVTLAVEGLRDHARDVGGSALWRGLRQLPAARAWLASERSKALERAARDVEAALGVPIGVIRDEVAGDALVLSLRPGPADKPEEARGLLLALPRDRALVDRLMTALNDAQVRGNELIGVEARSRGPARYSGRTFRDKGRPAEFYAQLEGGVFAWSNSEELLLGVIDRKLSGGPGLGDGPAFRKVRRGLPARSIASLFVDPRLVGRAMAGSGRPGAAGGDRLGAILGRYVAAVGYAGAAVEWRDGLGLHTHEAVDAAKLDPWLRRWLAGPRPASAPVPGPALAVASIHVDPEALREVARELIPEGDRPGLANLELALRGILLGRDPAVEVLPRLGPGLTLAVEPGPRFPVVAALDWRDRAGADDLAAPLDNALRTALAVYALDPSRRAAHLRVETREVGEARVTTLTDGLRPRLSYRVDRGRVVLGTTPEAVARFGAGASPARPRPPDLPEADTFAFVDLARLGEEVRALRGPIARRLASRSGRAAGAVDADLGQVLALVDLFRAATFTSVATPDAGEVHRTLRLIAR